MDEGSTNRHRRLAPGTSLPADARPSFFLLTLLFALILPGLANAQAPPSASSQQELRTTQDWNRRLGELGGEVQGEGVEYRIGADDLLEVTVFEAPELNRTLRVAAGGEISLPLLGAVRAAGLTPRELEVVLGELLRRGYIKEPHVGVFVREMQSHGVSVFGAVVKPGVFQIRGAKTLIEMLSWAEGLAPDAGETVVVLRGAGLAAPAASDNGSTPDSAAVEINLKELLESGEAASNVAIYPGDIIKVTRAGVVYVVGEVRKPGGFVLKSNENISVLQALALAEGLTRTAAKSQSRIIRSDEKTGERSEIPLNLGKILEGKAADPVLRPNDIVFVPNSAGRLALYRGLEAALSVTTGLIIWRR